MRSVTDSRNWAAVLTGIRRWTSRASEQSNYQCLIELLCSKTRKLETITADQAKWFHRESVHNSRRLNLTTAYFHGTLPPRRKINLSDGGTNQHSNMDCWATGKFSCVNTLTTSFNMTKNFVIDRLPSTFTLTPFWPPDCSFSILSFILFEKVLGFCLLLDLWMIIVNHMFSLFCFLDGLRLPRCFFLSFFLLKQCNSAPVSTSAPLPIFSARFPPYYGPPLCWLKNIHIVNALSIPNRHFVRPLQMRWMALCKNRKLCEIKKSNFFCCWLPCRLRTDSSYPDWPCYCLLRVNYVPSRRNVSLWTQLYPFALQFANTNRLSNYVIFCCISHKQCGTMCRPLDFQGGARRIRRLTALCRAFALPLSPPSRVDDVWMEALNEVDDPQTRMFGTEPRAWSPTSEHLCVDRTTSQ